MGNIIYSLVVTDKQYICNLAEVICLTLKSIEAGVKELKDFSIPFPFALSPFPPVFSGDFQLIKTMPLRYTCKEY